MLCPPASVMHIILFKSCVTYASYFFIFHGHILNAYRATYLKKLHLRCLDFNAVFTPVQRRWYRIAIIVRHFNSVPSGRAV